MVSFTLSEQLPVRINRTIARRCTPLVFKFIAYVYWFAYNNDGINGEKVAPEMK
jgi:hypothetical protein